MTKQQLAQLEAEAKAYSQEIDKLIGHEKHRRIKTAAYYGYLEAAKKYQGEIRAAEERMERMAKAMERLNSEIDAMWNTEGVSTVVPDDIIARIIQVQKKAFEVLTDYKHLKC